MKAIGDSRMRYFDANLNDLVPYIERRAQRITHDCYGRWLPQDVSLSFSFHYRYHCQVLTDKGLLVRLDSDPSSFRYQLQPKGDILLQDKWGVLQKKSYTGTYRDIVKSEMERRTKRNEFHGSVHMVDENTSASDIIVEYPISPSDENPCDVLCMVHTLANEILLNASIGASIDLHLGNKEESLYLRELEIGVGALYRVVYKHEREDGWFDVWLDGETLSVSYIADDQESIQVTSGRGQDERAKEIKKKQDKIRQTYYGLLE